MKITTLLGLSFILVFGLACSPGSGAPVHITVPNGYEGVFKIIADAENGRPIEKRDGHFHFEIPDDGVLRVKSTDPFRSFHETAVAYESGSRLPNGFLDLPEDTRAYYYLWSDTNGAIWFLIGTQEQYDAAQKAGRVNVGSSFLGDREGHVAPKEK